MYWANVHINAIKGLQRVQERSAAAERAIFDEYAAVVAAEEIHCALAKIGNEGREKTDKQRERERKGDDAPCFCVTLHPWFQRLFLGELLARASSTSDAASRLLRQMLALYAKQRKTFFIMKMKPIRIWSFVKSSASNVALLHAARKTFGF